MVNIRGTNDKLLDRAIRILLSDQPEMTREDAAALLEACDGHLKTAIVSARHGLAPQAAGSLIDQCHGSLRQALGAAAAGLSQR